MITQLRTWLLAHASVCEAVGNVHEADQIRAFVANELGDERTTALADQLQGMLAELGIGIA